MQMTDQLLIKSRPTKFSSPHAELQYQQRQFQLLLEETVNILHKSIDNTLF